MPVQIKLSAKKGITYDEQVLGVRLTRILRLAGLLETGARSATNAATAEALDNMAEIIVGHVLYAEDNQSIPLAVGSLKAMMDEHRAAHPMPPTLTPIQYTPKTQRTMSPKRTQ